MQALAMTANGADGTTKTEMEDVLGMSINELNKRFYTLRTSQKNNENSKLSTANSIWARNDVNVNQDFLQTNVDYYGADFFTAPFDDTTLTDINNWVNDKTDEMIPKILDEISADTAMYLINAVAFDAMLPNEGISVNDYVSGGNKGTQNIGDILLFCLKDGINSMPDGAFMLTGQTDISVFRCEDNEYISLGNEKLRFKIDDLLNI